ncbi:MAG: hypothetical protein HY293_04170 [Planctomycetes bacterium]|nr:hypothetical protein [Planctomycetota bacterium]
MIALLAVLLLQDAPAIPDPDVTCVDIVTFDIQNSETARAITVDGSILNRTPWPLTNVSIDIVILGDNKFPLGSMPRQSIATIAPRKGALISVKGVTVPLATRFSHRMTIRYEIDSKERLQVYENLVLKSSKVYVDPDAGPKAGVMGMFTIPGGYKTVNKQQVASGDTLFLRVRVDNIDEKALAGSTVSVTIAQDGRKQSAITRSIDANAVKTDFSKLPGNDADPKFMCYEGRFKDLVVGLRRVDNAGKMGKVTLDVKFTHKGQTWTWSDLDSPHLEALRPADKK